MQNHTTNMQDVAAGQGQGTSLMLEVAEMPPGLNSSLWVMVVQTLWR
jgi:hypothetical protein